MQLSWLDEGASLSTAFPITAASPGPIVALLIAMAIKHFVCDFLLQTSWMARGKERATGWLAPLLAHGLVHAGALLVVMLIFRPGFWWLSPIDLVLHCTIDRIKALISRATGFTPSDERFWWLLGLDQLLHQLTNVAFICAVLLVT